MCNPILVKLIVPTNQAQLKEGEGSATPSLIYYWTTH